jgi:hypothetical protein
MELDFDEPRYRMGDPRFAPNHKIIERLAGISAPYGTQISINDKGIGIVNLTR